ncbi:heterokaryon incompatibility protein-domain-containing protein [Hyaloscypha finlandica]|nr:heterokaryon incompatibility protein-domain-containing protein [Hyaloscypha finlandica]
MRLLKSIDGGEFSLTEDLHDNIPPYAILSHTWGADTEEVTFRDLTDGTGKDRASYDKIRFCEKQARRDGIQHFWVDTCCIDKANNSELAEAIASMFRWYQKAAICYVYLSDVSTNCYNQVDSSVQSWHSAFRKSRWFTRGWTLQELIAPQSVVFFCSNSNRLGDKKSLERLLHEITGIAVSALQGTTLSTFRVEERMSWAENRETKKAEDKAYSLLGIFDISMPVVYGEGEEKARRRLREEVYKDAKKRCRDEVSEAAFNPTKRLKTSRDQPSSVPSPTTKQSLIDQLYFTKIDERLISLTAAQGKTCRWFLTKPEYISWHDVTQQPDHGGFLWIVGNPGTGKSTLMKLLFDEARLDAKSDASKITLSFFFLARGTVEEKSTTGLYRSLLHQLFEKAEDLRESLEWMTADSARVIQRNGWHEEALKETLTHTIRKLGSRLLTIFIDALDECDDNQAKGMVSFFEELCDRAREAQVLLQICFSSRHYPTIFIQKCVKVTLEDEIGHTEDIQQYIKSKLKLGKPKQAEPLRSEILEKSSGIFLWVVLVLNILISEYPDSFVSIKKMRERLKKIPPKLTDLFEMILTRDGEKLERLQLCLKWILFATRPIKPQELYFAIQLGLDKSCSGCWDQEDVDLDQMKTYVRSSSKGLAEVTRNKASEVQFIHESVRGFLFGKYEGQWSGVSGNFVGHCHETLRDCCLAQLKASISQDVDIPDPLPQASKAAQLRETINLKFPFLEYSILNVLHHANSAQHNAIEQANFLAEFPLQQWKFLNNALEKFQIRRYNDPVSMLYILAEKNLADLIRIHSQRESCFDVENGRYGPPIFAALATSSSEAVRVLFNIQAQIQPPMSPLHDLCKQYCQDKEKWAILGRDFTFSRKRSVFSTICARDCGYSQSDAPVMGC